MSVTHTRDAPSKTCCASGASRSARKPCGYGGADLAGSSLTRSGGTDARACGPRPDGAGTPTPHWEKATVPPCGMAHKGDALKSLVTACWNRRDSVKRLVDTSKRPGNPHAFVTDKVRSCCAAVTDLELPDGRRAGRWRKTRPSTSHERFRRMRWLQKFVAVRTGFHCCSLPCAPLPAGTMSRPAAPLLSPNGLNAARPDTGRVWANGDCLPPQRAGRRSVDHRRCSDPDGTPPPSFGPSWCRDHPDAKSGRHSGTGGAARNSPPSVKDCTVRERNRPALRHPAWPRAQGR